MCKVEDTTGVNNGSTAQTMVSSVSLSAFFFLLMVCLFISFGGKSHFHSRCATTEACDFIPPQGNMTCLVRDKKKSMHKCMQKAQLTS